MVCSFYLALYRLLQSTNMSSLSLQDVAGGAVAVNYNLASTNFDAPAQGEPH